MGVDLYETISKEYEYYHNNAPYPIDELDYIDLLNFGEIDDNVYNNIITASLRHDDGKKLLTEAEFATYPSETTIKYISNALKISPKLFSIKEEENGAQSIFVIILNRRTIKDNIDKAMHLCGYYCARGAYVNGDKRFLSLKYEPKYIDDANGLIRKHKYLFHISPIPYKDKILKNGFIPKSNSSLFDYPDRCYFFLDTVSKKTILDWIPTFKTYKSKYTKEQYCLYTIDISKINDNVVFYLDPNLKGGVYTMDNIAPNTIINTEIIN